MKNKQLFLIFLILTISILLCCWLTSHFFLLIQNKNFKELMLMKNLQEWQTRFIKRQIETTDNIISNEKGAIWGFITGSITTLTAFIFNKKIQEDKE